jgi:hypothetical protein
MTSLDIVDLIEKNPITKLSSSYNNKLITKIKENFTDFEQQLFISSFYCYLNYDQKNDYIIDLDNVWKWLGFSQKIRAKELLEKCFVIDKDYKNIAFSTEKAKNIAPPNGGTNKNNHGGQNKQIYMMTIKTFKLLCLKAGTKKADEIHDYYLKMEEMLYEILQEESDELKLQLEDKNIIIDNKNIIIEQNEHKSIEEKELLVEKTLIAQFPLNTQCIYYGKIDNKSGGKPNSKMYHEDLIKFGQSNNLGERVKCHKRNFINFRLVGAFKVKNKIEIENAIKRHSDLKKRIRSLTTIENPNFKEETYRELLALNNHEFTIDKIHNYFQQIIKEGEYNIENYNLLLQKNDKLEDKVRELDENLKEKERENAKLITELEKYTSDITTLSQKKIASNFAICKYSYFLYAFECENMKYKCSITRQKDFDAIENNLKNIDKNGEMKYFVKVKYPFSEKIMMFLLKQSLTLLGNNTFQGSFDNVKMILDITLNLENLLIDNGNDLDKLNNILTNTPYSELSNLIDPETPSVKKAKRSIDQINKDTGEIIFTYESIESAGRALGLTTGTAVGIALREKRVCRGFLWRYTGFSKEDQYKEQPVFKICCSCSSSEKIRFTTIADAARDSNISAPALRQRIMTNVHINNHHWVFDKGKGAPPL